MIREFTDAFVRERASVESTIKEHPREYIELVKRVVEVVSTGEDGQPDADRIHSICDGGYQGTLVFVIAAAGCDPSRYWYVKVDYGSCAGCDLLERIRDYDSHNDQPSEKQVKNYGDLMLHIAQGLREME